MRFVKQWIYAILLGLVFYAGSSWSASLKVISLSPHLTEMVYALKAQNLLIGVDQYSHSQSPMTQLPNFGTDLLPDLEKLAVAKPDLVLVFQSNRGLSQLAQRMGFQIFKSNPLNLNEIVNDTQRLANVLGVAEQNQALITQLKENVKALSIHYANSSIVPIFILVGTHPVYSLGGPSFLSQALETCGVKNIFNDINTPSFIVNQEELFARRPFKVLLGIRDLKHEAQERQEALESLRHNGVVVDDHDLISVDSDLIYQPSVRFLMALPGVCEAVRQ